MNKEQFIELLRAICEQIPDNEIRKEYLQNEFLKYGYSIEAGYKVVNYYFTEIKKGFEGKESVYKGKFIINNEQNFYGYLSENSYKVDLKISIEGFNKLECIFINTFEILVHSENKKNNMNYKEIVLNGYIQTETKYLYQYFIDEAKKTTNYEMFFSGCNNIVGYLKKDINNQMYDFKKEITESLQGHKEENNINDIIEHEQILKDLKIEDFEINLSNFTKFELVGSIPYFDIINIEQAIERAKNELTPKAPEIKEDKQKKAGRKKTNTQPLNNYFFTFENENITVFIQKLKEKYAKNIECKEFVYLINILKSMGLIKFDTQKEIYEAFEKAFENSYGTTSGKNSIFRNCSITNDSNLWKKLQKEINEIININVIN